MFVSRETREGWPLQTVETEVNGDSRVQMKRVLHWLVRWLAVPVLEIFFLVAPVGSEENIFSSLYTISTPLSPSPRKLGRQSCWVRCRLLCVSVRILLHLRSAQIPGEPLI
jgi:hypothetical protein